MTDTFKITLDNTECEYCKHTPHWFEGYETMCTRNWIHPYKCDEKNFVECLPENCPNVEDK